MIEQESKKIISYKEYDRINRLVKWEKEYMQINYYFDTEDFQLAYNGITCRVRDKNSSLYFQIKYPDSSDNCSARVREENEYKIDCITETIPYDIYIKLHIEKYVSNYNDIKLRGSMITYRKECDIGSGAVLFLDKNIYLDKLDYEIELEYGVDSTSMLFDFLKIVDINFETVARGKNSRFVNRLRDICQNPPNIKKGGLLL